MDVPVLIPSKPSAASSDWISERQSVASTPSLPFSNNRGEFTTAPSPRSTDPESVPTPLSTSPGKNVRSSRPEGEGEDGDESDPDEDGHGLTAKPNKARKVTEKRRAENALFKSWLEKNQDTVVKEPPKAPTADPRFLSAAKMVKENENKKIIQSPREYQMELFERAKKKNTIAVLETGM